MKWIILTGILILTTGCCTTTVVECKSCVVSKARAVPVKPVVVTRVVSPVIEPVLVDYVEPVDVTTTTIDFY